MFETVDRWLQVRVGETVCYLHEQVVKWRGEIVDQTTVVLPAGAEVTEIDGATWAAAVARLDVTRVADARRQA